MGQPFTIHQYNRPCRTFNPLFLLFTLLVLYPLYVDTCTPLTHYTRTTHTVNSIQSGVINEIDQINSVTCKHSHFSTWCAYIFLASNVFLNLLEKKKSKPQWNKPFLLLTRVKCENFWSFRKISTELDDIFY